MEKKIASKKRNLPQNSDEILIGEIRGLIEQTRSRVAQTVNSALVLMNWHIGKRIKDEILQNKRAEYGKEIVSTLARQLTVEFGSSFDKTNLTRIIKFAEIYPDIEIVVTLSQQLNWSHFLAILPIKDQLKRDFYAEMCRLEGWNVRTLRQKIQGMLFERTAISRKPEETIKNEIAEFYSLKHAGKNLAILLQEFITLSSS